MGTENKLWKWRDIEKEFNGKQSLLVLGNGASIALHEEFKNIPEGGKKLFEILRKKNRESSELANNLVNFFYKKYPREKKSYEDFLVDLIMSVDFKEVCFNKKVNCKDFIRKLVAINQQEDQKHTIILSLNYDIFLYKMLIAMKSDLKDNNLLKDYFDRELDGFEARNAKRNPLIYKHNPGPGDYKISLFNPHGSLLFYREKKDQRHVYKAKADNASLIIEIKRIIEEGKGPIIVAGETSNEKLDAIAKDYSLKSMNEKWRELVDKKGKEVTHLISYGWRMDAVDNHILEGICTDKIKKIAISIHESNAKTMSRLEKKLPSTFKEKNCTVSTDKDIKDNPRDNEVFVYFFDAKSPGCWCHPREEETKTA